MLLYYSADEDLEKEISTTVQDAFKTYGGNETSSAAITDGIDMFQVSIHVIVISQYTLYSIHAIVIRPPVYSLFA